MNDTADKSDKDSDSVGVAIPAISPKIDNELDVIVAPPPAKNTKLVRIIFIILLSAILNA